MPLSIQVPVVGLSNATEESKLANDMTQLAAWANGNIADTDLRSSNNSVRRLILQATAILDDTTPAGDLVYGADSFPIPPGAATYSVPAVWVGDSGVSGQPPGFQVPNKNSVARVRTGLAVASAASVTITPGLYQITGVAGTGPGGRGIAYSFGTAFPGSTAVSTTPGAGIVALETTEFFLPTTQAVYALGVNLSARLAAGVAIAVTSQLYAYNA